MNRWHQLELERAQLCRTTAPNMTTTELVAYYSIDQRVAHELWGIVEPANKQRKQKPAEVLATFARSNVFAHITSKEVCEMCECSTPTALRLLEARPDVFKKIKRGVWEIRDPQADRQADKGK